MRDAQLLLPQRRQETNAFRTVVANHFPLPCGVRTLVQPLGDLLQRDRSAFAQTSTSMFFGSLSSVTVYVESGWATP